MDIAQAGPDRPDASNDVLRNIAKEICEKAGCDVGNHAWNPGANIELTLSAAECRKVLELTGMYREKVTI